MAKKIILGTAISLMLLAGCGNGNENSNGAEDTETDTNESTEEVSWAEDLLDPNDPSLVRFYSYTLGVAGATEGIENLVQEFNDTVGSEKGIELEAIHDADYQKSTADIQAGLQVDIVQQTFRGMASDIQSKDFVPLESVIPEDLMDEHFAPFPENAMQLGDLNGNTYSIAWTFSTPILFMNMDLLEEAGIEADGGPENWEEIYEWAQQVTDNTDAYGFGYSPGTDSTQWSMDSILYSGGASVLNEDGTEAIFNSPEAIEVYEFLDQFYVNDLSLKGTDDEILESFLAGNTAMYIQSTAGYNAMSTTFNENGWNLDGYPIPGFGSEDSVPTNSGSGLSIRQPEDEKQAQAVWEVIKFLTGKEAYTIITSEIGYLPLRTDITDDPEYLQPFLEENPIIQRNIERLPDIKSQTQWPAEGYPTTNEVFTNFRQKIFTTDSDIQQEADQAVKQMNQLLPEEPEF